MKSLSSISKNPIRLLIMLSLLSLSVYMITNYLTLNIVPSKTNSCGLSDFESLFYTEGINRHHYNISSHYLTTTDGYKLMIFRVRLTLNEHAKLPKSLKNNFKKKLLLIHEFAGSSDSYFYNGQNSMGFHLLSQGFDIWVANNRGNKYSSES